MVDREFLHGLAAGTHLVVSRRGYRHHGIYVGQGRVIHYAGPFLYPRGCVEEDVRSTGVKVVASAAAE
jgi:Lecithin retinol acyltransferase